MRKLILPIALMSASFALAVDVELHGSVNFDYGSYFDEHFSPINAANQDIDLSAKANMDENVSVTVKANTHTSYQDTLGHYQASETRRHFYAHSTAMGDGGKYTEFNFDGVELRWDITHDIGLVFGDLTYSAGAFSTARARSTSALPRTTNIPRRSSPPIPTRSSTTWTSTSCSPRASTGYSARTWAAATPTCSVSKSTTPRASRT